MNSLKRATNLLQKVVPYTQQCRNTVVVERMYPCLKYDADKPMKRRHYVFKLDETVKVNTKVPPMDVLLVTDVQGLGRTGEIVTVPAKVARNKLLLCGVAVYPSPENMQQYYRPPEEDDGPRQTKSGERTTRAIATLHLPIPMHPTNPWTLNKQHVRLAFRKIGVMLSDDNIEMPDEVIKQPGDLKLKITINGLDTVTVKATVYPHYKNPLEAPGGANFKVPKVWGPSKVIIEDVAQLMFQKNRENLTNEQEQSQEAENEPESTR